MQVWPPYGKARAFASHRTRYPSGSTRRFHKLFRAGHMADPSYHHRGHDDDGETLQVRPGEVGRKIFCRNAERKESNETNKTPAHGRGFICRACAFEKNNKKMPQTGTSAYVLSCLKFKKMSREFHYSQRRSMKEKWRDIFPSFTFPPSLFRHSPAAAVPPGAAPRAPNQSPAKCLPIRYSPLFHPRGLQSK